MKNAVNFRKKALTRSIRLFLLQKLPLAYIAGVKVTKFDEQGTETCVKFGWINQNPFRSIYFAAMHMAAELATGLLLFQYLDEETRFSMLLVKTNASFSKKACGKIRFECKQGEAAHSFITHVLNTSEGDSIDLPVISYNESNEEVARFNYTWSCRKK